MSASLQVPPLKLEQSPRREENDSDKMDDDIIEFYDNHRSLHSAWTFSRSHADVFARFYLSMYACTGHRILQRHVLTPSSEHTPSGMENVFINLTAVSKRAGISRLTTATLQDPKNWRHVLRCVPLVSSSNPLTHSYSSYPLPQSCCHCSHTTARRSALLSQLCL